MRLVLPSASATAVFSASLQFNNNIRTVVASILDTATTNGPKGSARKTYISDECSFTKPPDDNRFTVNSDLGVLDCANPNYVCVQDANSSLGGRCTLRLDHTYSTDERELQTCVKCQGTDACKGLAQAVIDKIACGSCIGTKACEGLACKYDIRCRTSIWFQ